MADRVVRIGVCGLGRGFLLTAPALMGDPRVQLTAAADPRPEARDRFEREFGGRAYVDLGGLCNDPTVDVVYVASPHHLHAEHTIVAARAGKHVFVEKPMALSVADGRAMIDAARGAGVHLLVGPSHGFDAPIELAARMIEAGDYGAPRMVTALNYTDFLYRPRRPDELDTNKGGGVIFNQAPHQVDIVRRLIGAPVASVRALTGAWDEARPTEGAYAALLTFDGGAVASLSYSGYGRFDSDELSGWIDELGAPKNPNAYGLARRALASGAGESSLRTARMYGDIGLPTPTKARLHEHFGLVIVSCERADLRPTPEGVVAFGNTERRLHRLEMARTPRAGVIDEVCAAAIEGRAPRHDGAWGLATLEVCLAILTSSREGREIRLAAAGTHSGQGLETTHG